MLPQDLEEIVDAIHDVTVDDAEWGRRIAAAAARAFEGRSASLDRIGHRRAAHLEVASNVVRVVVPYDDDASVMLTVACDRPVRLGHREERVLVSAVAVHLANAVRARHRPGSVRGFVGRDSWMDVLDGRAALVTSHSSAGSYLVVDTPAEWHARRALTPLERRVVTLAARGMTCKELAYALHVSNGRVSQALRSAASKIGVRTTFDLVRIAACFAREGPSSVPAVDLTDAERGVLDLVCAGLSNRAIAERRGRSPRTVANQVASLLRKTNTPSRRTLAAWAAAGPVAPCRRHEP